MNGILTAGLTLILGAGVVGHFHQDIHQQLHKAHEHIMGADQEPEKSKPFAIVAHFEPKDEHAAELLELLLASGSATEGEPGLLEYHIIRPQEKKGPLTFVSIWKNQKSFESFTKTERFREMHGPEAMGKAHDWSKKIWALHSDVLASWRRPKKVH